MTLTCPGFLLNDTATTEIYTLSLHDALPISAPLKATLRLVVWEELEDKERRPKDIIEKEVNLGDLPLLTELGTFIDRKSTRLNSSHGYISYAVFCLKKKKQSLHNVRSGNVIV